jgi:UDP-3-O-[3-hydroxymyristoyl] glucosamine N-acyltransferase
MVAYTLGDLARVIGAQLEGDPSIVVDGVAGLEEAGPRDLSFLANPKYREAALKSSAGALVAGSGDQIDGRPLLRSDNPYLAFARAVEVLSPGEALPAGVHPTAVVDPSAKIPSDAGVGAHAVIEAEVELGAGVLIGAGSVIERGVTIGEGTHIFPRVTIHRGTRIGRRCVVQSGSVLGSEGFGYATEATGRHHPVPQRGGLEIADEVDIGANVTIDRGSIGDTVIGAGTKIDNLVHVAHNVRIGRNAIIVAQVGIAGSTRIGDFVVFGGQSGAVGHITIGDRARVGARAGVIGDIPAATEVSGYPARPHRQEMKMQALLRRLPELFERMKALEEKLRNR